MDDLTSEKINSSIEDAKERYALILDVAINDLLHKKELLRNEGSFIGTTNFQTLVEFQSELNTLYFIKRLLENKDND